VGTSEWVRFAHATPDDVVALFPFGAVAGAHGVEDDVVNRGVVGGEVAGDRDGQIGAGRRGRGGSGDGRRGVVGREGDAGHSDPLG